MSWSYPGVRVRIFLGVQPEIGCYRFSPAGSSEKSVPTVDGVVFEALLRLVSTMSGFGLFVGVIDARIGGARDLEGVAVFTAASVMFVNKVKLILVVIVPKILTLSVV